ncbi:M24 family metallopeptidase [Oceanicola sp. D3]|uniref:M24 family metallopeptidase n=1 Tax=Oceanicola sp. D3 TaxID=2587163 RepID=UPI00111DBB53|nr:M24 family metallopeptidase [Oceanicola sp. D3]QDC11654.1 M24 family metallopeptidase [Oceanicola sp. D3]
MALQGGAAPAASLPSSALAFARTEYHERLAAVRASMEEKGLEVLVISDPSNMNWLTGYDGWSFYVHQAVIVSMKDDPVWWGRGMDAAGARRTVWMSQDHIFGYEDWLVQNPDAHPMTVLAQLVSDSGHGASRIGVELDNYYYSAAAHLALTAGLPDADVADATGLVNWCRAVKSPAEISYMRRAGEIVTEMHRVIAEVAEPGMQKNALVAEILKAGALGTRGAWGDYPAIVPMTPSGMDATAPHLTWDGAPILRGTPTFFEIAGCHRRYHCPQSRTLFFGEPPNKYRKAEEALMAATAAVMGAARPGATCAEVALSFTQTLNRYGFEKNSRCGYSVGLSYPPDWGERTMSLREGDETELEAGMVFHFMPGLWLDDGGIELTETMLINEVSAEYLATTPPGLVVKP